jgi:hypothetical protein
MTTFLKNIVFIKTPASGVRQGRLDEKIFEENNLTALSL